MPEWMVRLVGEERDLRFLASTLHSADCRVTEEDGEFHLRSNRFARLAGAREAKTAACEMLELANLAASRRVERYRGVLAAEVVGLEPDGSRHVSVFLETAVGVASGSALVVGCSTKPQPPDLTWDMSLLGRQPALREALSYLRDEPNWYGYYKAYEAVRNAVGGERDLIRTGWVTKKALSRFTYSAQPARHHDCSGPEDRMTEAEGRSFVLQLLQWWFD